MKCPRSLFRKAVWSHWKKTRSEVSCVALAMCPTGPFQQPPFRALVLTLPPAPTGPPPAARELFKAQIWYVALFLKTPKLLPGKGTKPLPWSQALGLSPQQPWWLHLTGALLPHAHSSDRPFTVDIGPLHVLFLAWNAIHCSFLLNNSYSSLSPQLHITLQGTEPPRPLGSPDYMLIRDHAALHNITGHSYNSALVLWLLAQSLSPLRL